MDTTPNLRLPYLLAAQAQKHVTHNEALRMLDAIVQLAIADRDLAAPPPAPAEGANYIVAAGASDAWTGHDGEIAAWQDGAWAFLVPRAGWIGWIADEGRAVVFDGAGWIELAGGGAASVNPAALVGVNTIADATNKLAVKSDAVLLTYDDVTPGTGDMRQVLNKASATHTVSQLYQSNWSGRAETGLTGDDDFHLKVSADGSAWHEALVVDKATGEVHFPNTPLAAPTVSSLTPVKTKILANAADVTILFIGDSTGDASHEWPYRFAQWLGAEHPTHTVQWHQHNGTAYAAPVSLSAGSGARTIHVYNASVGGYHISRWMTHRYASAIGALTPDLIITNDGVNPSTSSVDDVRRLYLGAFQQILLEKPGTPIAVALQHPFRDDDGMDSVIEALRQVAGNYPGMTLIDGHARFVEAGKPAAWYENNTHPNAIGSGIILDELLRHWRAARDRPPITAFDSWWADRADFNLIPNGDFAAFDGVLPDYWHGNGADVSKETTLVYPGKPHSVAVTGTNRTLRYRVEGEPLRALRGKRVTLAVRVYSPTGVHDTVGKFWCEVDGAVAGGFSVNTGPEGAGWQWQVIDGIRLPPAATLFEVVLASTGTGLAGGTAYFDEVILYQGEAQPDRTAEIRTDADNAAAVFNLLQDAGRFGGTPEPQAASAPTFSAPNYIFAQNGATIAQGPKFIFNNDDYGGSAGTLDADVLALVQKTKDPHIHPSYGRYGVEYYVLDFTAGTGTSGLRTIDGLAHYLLFSIRSAPIPMKLSFNCHVLVKSGSLGVTLANNNKLFIDGNPIRADQPVLPADGWRQVTRLYDINPRRTAGYDNILHNLYATPGAQIYLAMPALCPGHIPIAPGYFYGVIPSLEAWR